MLYAMTAGLVVLMLKVLFLVIKLENKDSPMLDILSVNVVLTSCFIFDTNGVLGPML